MRILNKIVITSFIPPGCKKETIVSAMLEEDKLAEVQFGSASEHTVLKNIYVGRVQNVIKNINAAFIEFEKGIVGYYPLEELPTAIFTNKCGKKPIVIGDELLVQVAKDAVKTKAAVLTTNLSLTAHSFVVTTGKKEIGVSGKLSGETKIRLKKLVEQNQSGRYGWIVRTNAAQLPEAVLIKELQLLEQRVDALIENARHRTVFSLVQGAQPDYINLLAGAYASQKDEIVTDKRELYEEIRAYLEQSQPEDLVKLRFYEDSMLPLYKLYNLEKQLETAERTHVWLKSGAYLIIEQTEACTVIDVNTGKYEGRKSRKDTFLNINLEAARECARQMRLRNLSGIILIDFINMTEPSDNELLMNTLEELVKKDRIKTHVVDMTALGIVELTRKKERCTLKEAMAKLL